MAVIPDKTPSEGVPLPLPWFARQPACGLLAGAGAALAVLLAIMTLRALVSYGLLFPADRARDLHEYDRAEGLYRLARAWDPFNWQPHLGIAWVTKNRGVWSKDPVAKERYLDQALALYLEHEKRNPYEPAFAHGLSEIYTLRGEMDKALERLQQLVRDHPRRPFFWTRLGTHLRRMGRDAEAEEAFRRALTLDGADTTARLNLMAIEQKRKASARPPAR